MRTRMQSSQDVPQFEAVALIERRPEPNRIREEPENPGDRIETDREGNVIMIPPGDVGHGMRIIRFGNLFTECMPEGIALGEFAVSTSSGNRIPDCGWASEAHPEFQWLLADEPEAQERPKVLKHAPEICVEILSASNTPAEIELKKRLYFDVGAKEVWVCDRNGAMKFFGPEGELPCSNLCPDWPQVVPLRSAKRISAGTYSGTGTWTGGSAP